VSASREDMLSGSIFYHVEVKKCLMGLDFTGERIAKKENLEKPRLQGGE
jgi:hypothetical protein